MIPRTNDIPDDALEIGHCKSEEVAQEVGAYICKQFYGIKPYIRITQKAKGWYSDGWYLWLPRSECSAVNMNGRIVFNEHKAERLRTCFHAWMAGHTAALAPYVAAAEEKAKAEEATWQELVNKTLDSFFDSTSDYDTWVNYYGDTPSRYTHREIVNLPKSKLLPAFWQSGRTNHRPWARRGISGSMISGSFNKVEMVAHLRAWMEKKPDERADPVYEKIIKYIERQG